MRRLLLTRFAVGVAASLLAGCSRSHHSPNPSAPVTPAKSPATTAEIITPADTVDALVLSVNPTSQYVVLNFPDGHPLPPGRLLGVYHEGLRTAEVRVSGPQSDNNTVADILKGKVHRGDTAHTE